MTNEHDGAGTAVQPKRRRIWKILGGLAVLFVVLLLVAPLIAQPIVERMVVEAIEENLAVEATIDSLKLSLGGSVTVEGLHLVDESGRDVVELERLHASVALLSALRGTYEFDAAVEGLTARLYEESDGTWSAQKLPRERAPKADEPEKEGGLGSFDLHGVAALKNAQVVLVRSDGTNVHVMVDSSATFAGPDVPAVLAGAVEVLASTAPPGTRAGRMVASAQLPGDPGRWTDVRELTASFNVDFENPIDLASLAAGLPLPVELVSGVLGGKGEVRLAPGLDVAATAGFTIDGLELRGPRADAPPLKIARVSLISTTEREGDALAPRLTLRADDAFALDLTSTLSGAGTPDARLTGTLALDGDVDRLAGFAEGWIELQEGLSFEGALVGNGTFEVALAANALARGATAFKIGFEGLTVLHSTQGPLDLGTLGDPSFEFDARYDAQAGTLDVPSFALLAGPVHAEGATALRDLTADIPTLGATRVDVAADLDALMEAIAGVVVLGDTTLGGNATAHFEAEEKDGELPLTARLEARGLRLGLGAGGPGGAPTEYGDLTAGMRGTWRRASDAVVLDELTLTCQGLDARGSGSLAGVMDAPTKLPAVTLDLAIDADPSNLPAWVHAALGDKRIAGADCRMRVKGSWTDNVADAAIDIAGRDVAVVMPGVLELHAGSLRTELNLAGMLDALRVTGNGEMLVLDLKTEPPAPEEGVEPKKGIELVEPRMLFDIDATVGIARGDVDLRKLHLESRAMSGDVDGRITGLMTVGKDVGGELVVETLKGDLTYVPDRVAAALGPWIPGELSGADPQPCRFQLDGRMSRLDAAAAVEGLTGTVDVGVGRYRQTGLDLGGAAHLELKGGQATLTSKLAANGGEMTLDGGLKITPRGETLVMQGSSLSMDAKDVQANTGLAPLLGFIHPAFASLDSVSQTQFGGVIACNVDLRYDGELDVATLAGGWDALPKGPIQGKITFGIDTASLVGSPLIQDLLGKLDLGGQKDFSLKPITLDVRDGRVHYANPWEWTVSGAQTSFGGSIGLDKSLDLKWSIPISDEMAARNGYLAKLAGQTIVIPLKGSITRPKLEFDAAVKDMAKGLVKDALTGGLKDVLDSQLGKGGDEGGANDPADLLKRADELWKAGDKAAAAPLYRELRDKHKLTLLYLKNRSKIEDRADWKP